MNRGSSPLLAGCTLLCLAGAAPTFAADSSKFGVVVEADLEYGGDDLATVEFTDGSSQHVKGGQGVTLALGGHFRADPVSPFSVRGTVGYKYVTTKADNADISVSRVVLEIVGNYRWQNDIWIGAGISRHSNIKFKTDGFGSDVSFDDATGPTLELGWKWFALSYTNLEYTDEFGDAWDASSIGLTIVSKF